MMYVYVAVGGAFGSVMRAWLSVVVARITGPQFPWGTILINIVGSFIIGYVGAVTANDSRFADLRALVMVGVCGGFTTFSSFSLQTLDLARDGRVAQAMANIGLSVVLCLLAVTAGHYGGAASRRPFAAAASIKEAPHTVLVVVNRPERTDALLDAATRLLESEPSGHVRVLAIPAVHGAELLPSEEVVTAERRAEMQAEREHWAEQVLALVDARRARAAPQGVWIDWRDAEGDPAEIVAAEARQCQAVVMPRPGEDEAPQVWDCLHAALFDSSTPVLVVPAASGAFGQVVAIAWQDDGRAARAVQAAVPMIRRARQVHVLQAGGPAVMPAILRNYAITAEMHAVSADAGATGEALLRAAHDVGADLLVMGAFSHGEWRERMFGGVTRTMLARADLPLLLRH